MIPQIRLSDVGTWAAAGQGTIRLTELPEVLEGCFVHLAGFEVRIDGTYTAGGAGVDTPALDLARVIAEIRLVDRVGNVVYRAAGDQAVLIEQLLTGHRAHPLPAVLAAAGGAGLTRTTRFLIPFANIIGMSGAKDALQPVARFKNGGRIELTYGVAASIGGGGAAVITAGTVSVTPVLCTLPYALQGCDIRTDYNGFAAGARFDQPMNGIKTLLFALTNVDRDHSDYTSLTLGSQLINAVPLDRVAMWTAVNALDDADNLISSVTPEVLPIVFPRRGDGITDLYGFGGTTAVLQTTTTHAAAQRSAVVELFDRRKLVAQLVAQQAGDLYSRYRGDKPRYDNKQKPGQVDAMKATVFNCIGPTKLILS